MRRFWKTVVSVECKNQLTKYKVTVLYSTELGVQKAVVSPMLTHQPQMLQIPSMMDSKGLKGFPVPSMPSYHSSRVIYRLQLCTGTDRNVQ